MATRRLSTIATEISNKWPNMYFGAQPYVDAMRRLGSIKDTYGHDSAASVVVYFLANASSWRGEDAKRIKGELKAMLKEA